MKHYIYVTVASFAANAYATVVLGQVGSDAGKFIMANYATKYNN
jgi:hypothetical protein